MCLQKFNSSLFCLLFRVFAAISKLEESLTEPLVQRHTSPCLILLLALLVRLFSLFHPLHILGLDRLITILTGFLHRDDSLLLAVRVLFARWQRLNDRSSAVHTACDVEHVVIHFKLSLREGTLYERTLTVAQLADFIITPNKHSTVVKCGHAVTSATLELVDVKGFLFLVDLVVQL
jgi:hypothetical protein